MSSEVAIQTCTTEPSRGTGKKGNRSRGPNRNQRANGGNKGKNAQSIGGSSPPGEPGDASSQVSEVVEQMSAVAVSEAGDSDICWICAEPVKYWAVPECNHRVCHVCAIRLRALYKKMECTFCKEPQATMIFTSSPNALFASFTPETIPFKDSKLSVYFETQDMMEDTLILLRFNCPDQECDYIGNGWGDLRLHVRAVHGKLMCDLCIRNKKVFAHEHAIYPPSLLPVHLPSIQQRASKAALKEPIEGGVHPLCAFCRECFFGDDELYGHMREKHEECFICKRNEIRDQYFQNYDSLERHFSSAHHACTNAECLARKFVVFNTPLDLKAHMVEEHGGDMSSRDRKDARRVQADFTFEEVGRRRDRDRDRERDRDRDRDREPHQLRPPPAQASTPAAARPPAPASRRREGFGGALTDSSAAQASTSNANNGRGSRPVSRPVSPPPAASSAEIDPAIAERHAAFLIRLQSLAPNPTTAIPVVKAATRGYRSSESNARDLISTIWNVMDQNLEQTASIINAFVDLLDEEEKKADLLSSWKGFAIEQRRHFPDLTPSAIGAGYAGITSGRVLNAKHATATRSSQSQQVWNRVAQAASSSSSLPPPKPQEKFPALAPSSSIAPSTSATPFRQGQRSTPWSGSSAAPPALRTQQPVSMPASGSNSLAARSRQAPPPKLSNAVFPELPSSASARSKPQVSGNVSLKKILGSTGAPAVSAWSAPGQASGGSTIAQEAIQVADEGVETTGGPAGSGGATTKGRKGKGKQKQTLFTLGAFPT